jgi:hypothetical protein
MTPQEVYINRLPFFLKKKQDGNKGVKTVFAGEMPDHIGLGLAAASILFYITTQTTQNIPVHL